MTMWKWSATRDGETWVGAVIAPDGHAAHARVREDHVFSPEWDVRVEDIPAPESDVTGTDT